MSMFSESFRLIIRKINAFPAILVKLITYQSIVNLCSVVLMNVQSVIISEVV